MDWARTNGESAHAGLAGAPVIWMDADLLEELACTIHALRVRIRVHRPYLETYESRTRTSLIDPLLGALGWDVSNPAHVEIEPKIAGGWADYALLDEKAMPVALIEAKRLADKDADSALTQSSAYLMTHNRNNPRKIIYCGWTNGDKWELVDITKQETVLEASITTARTTPAKIALGILGLWRGSMQDGSYDDASTPLTVIGNESDSDESTIEPPPRTKVEPERYRLRFRFFEGLLERAKSFTQLHANIRPKNYSWLGAGSGISGVTYNYVVLEHSARIEIYVDTRDWNRNSQIFESLRAHKESIEAAFGSPLNWENNDGTRACKINKTYDLGGYRNETVWPKIFDDLTRGMAKLETAARPHIARIQS